jgi:hypothetical protein
MALWSADLWGTVLVKTWIFTVRTCQAVHVLRCTPHMLVMMHTLGVVESPKEPLETAWGG